MKALSAESIRGQALINSVTAAKLSRQLGYWRPPRLAGILFEQSHCRARAHATYRGIGNIQNQKASPLEGPMAKRDDATCAASATVAQRHRGETASNTIFICYLCCGGWRWAAAPEVNRPVSCRGWRRYGKRASLMTKAENRRTGMRRAFRLSWRYRPVRCLRRDRRYIRAAQRHSPVRAVAHRLAAIGREAAAFYIHHHEM